MDNKFKKIIRPLITGYGRWVEKRHFSDKPVFIVACPRSGTTMLLSILSAHPDIFTINHQTYAFVHWENKEGGVYPSRIDRLYREFIFRIIKPGAKRWCEKTPRHILYLKEILDYLPEAKIIHLIRDGRDVVTSKHPYHYKKREYWVSPGSWVNYVKKGLEFENCKNVYHIKYEDILNDYHSEISKLLGFLGEEYCENMKDWFRHAKIRNSKHLKDGVQKLHTKSVGKWRLPEHKEVYEKLMENEEAVELLKHLKYID